MRDTPCHCLAFAAIVKHISAGLKFEGLRKDKRARMKDDEAKKENDDAGSFPQPRLDFHRFKYFPRLFRPNYSQVGWMATACSVLPEYQMVKVVLQ